MEYRNAEFQARSWRSSPQRGAGVGERRGSGPFQRETETGRGRRGLPVLGRGVTALRFFAACNPSHLDHPPTLTRS